MDDLVGFAEFALALAGFASVALILGRREGVLPPGSAYLVRVMVVNALGPAVLALFAYVLLRLEVPEPLLWRICSGFYLGAISGFVPAAILQERKLRGAGAEVMPQHLLRVFWAASLIAHAIQIANLIGWPVGPSLGVMLLGLWVLLAMAAGQFTYLLFATLR